MPEKEKIKKDESVSFSTEDRKKMIEDQLSTAIKKREEYTSLIFKCQGALELLDSIENDGKNND